MPPNNLRLTSGLTFTRLPVLMLATALLTACTDGSSNNQPSGPPPAAEATTGTLEIIHASQDAPAVNVLIDDTERLSAVPYKSVQTITLTTGERTVAVEGIVPGGNVTVIPSAGDPAPVVPLTEDARVTIIAAGDVSTIAPIVLAETPAPVDPTEVRVRVVHAASTAPQVNVHITGPDDPLGAPAGTFSFGDPLTTDALVVPAGTYRIRVAPSVDPANVVYDSGAIELPGGADLVVAAVVNTGPGDSPISLLASTGSAGLEFLDAATPSAVRAIHASPDAPPVDIVANDAFTAPIVEDLAYAATTTYLNPPPGPINLKVVPAGATAPVVIDADLTLVQGAVYSVYAAGLLTPGEIAPLVVVDDPRPVATEARLRLLHISPAAGDVDIYVVAAGAGADLSAVEPAFTAVPFLADTGYVSLAAGDYDVVVTPTGSKLPAIGPLTLSLSAGGIYTAAARDEVGGGLPLGLITLDDLAP